MLSSSLNLQDVETYEESGLTFSISLREEDVRKPEGTETVFFCIRKGDERFIFPMKDPLAIFQVRSDPRELLKRYLPMCLSTLRLSS